MEPETAIDHLVIHLGKLSQLAPQRVVSLGKGMKFPKMAEN